MARRNSASFFNISTAKFGTSDAPGWRFLEGRLQTYIAYDQLVAAAAASERGALPLLLGSPGEAIRKVLVLAHLRFLSYMDYSLPSAIRDWLEGFGPPEEFASIASLLVAVANKHKPLASIDFVLPLASDIASAEMRALMEYGRISHQSYEVSKDISIFGYGLEAHRGGSASQVFYLRPPTPEFEYAMRLGFIRSQVGRSKARMDATLGLPVRPMSILGAAEVFAARLRDRICELKDGGSDWRRIVLKFPAIPELYRGVLSGGFYEDFAEQEELGLDFLAPLSRRGEPQIQLTDRLDIATFLRIWRLLRFLCFVDICAVRSFENMDPSTLFNSVLRIAKEKDLVALVASMGIKEEEISEFLRLVAADTRRLGYLDIQYRPFLRLAPSTLGGYTSPPEILHVPALVGFANVLRNVQSANQLRLPRNAELFVEAVADLLSRHFSKVTVNRRVKSKVENTDIDVAVLADKTLYLFECKHSVPPTGSHEMRNVWEDVEKGVRQLETALRLLADRARLRDYLTGWFPGVTDRDTADVSIVPCVICSHRIFGGLCHAGVPIRDFSSLAKLTQDGVVGLGAMSDTELVLHRFRVTRREKFSAEDLDDYLSADSKFFAMFAPFMHPVSRLARCADVSVARETYVYEVDSEEWIFAHGVARIYPARR